MNRAHKVSKQLIKQEGCLLPAVGYLQLLQQWLTGWGANRPVRATDESIHLSANSFTLRTTSHHRITSSQRSHCRAGWTEQAAGSDVTGTWLVSKDANYTKMILQAAFFISRRYIGLFHSRSFVFKMHRQLHYSCSNNLKSLLVFKSDYLPYPAQRLS